MRKQRCSFNNTINSICTSKWMGIQWNVYPPVHLIVVSILTLFSISLAQSAEESKYPTFTDVTLKAGIQFQHSIGDHELSNIIEGTGAGCSFFDYDGDSDLDIYLMNGTYVKDLSHIRGRVNEGKLFNALYRNNGDGTFTDVSKEAGVAHPGFGMACVAADYDNDGDSDLWITNWGPNVLYRNNGNGTFTDVTKEAGLESDLWGIGSVFFDYDKDGNLDLYVGNYLLYDPDYTYHYAPEKYPGPLSYEGQPDILYHNNGDGTFSDVTEEAGVYNPEGRAMGVSSCDIDNDGDMDVFVANDGMENYLYRNNGDNTFTNIALETATGFGQSGEATSAMGPEFGDFDLDGYIDLLVPDMGYSCIYRNTGLGFFEEMSARMGLAASCGQYTSWSGNFFDFDCDGYLDIFIANGDSHKLDAEEDILLRNVNGLRFEDISSECGPDFQDKFVSRGSAIGDYDDDGDLDVLVLNINNRARLLRNEGGNRNHWLKIHTIGTISNRDGIGTRIRVTVGGKTQTRDIVSSSGYLSQNDYRAHFGLGQFEKVDTIEVRWPSGKKQVLENVMGNQVLVLKEPK